MDDNGTYLGNIYGIYKECITNISIDIYDITINKWHACPGSYNNNLAKESGRKEGGCESVFSHVSRLRWEC